MSKGTYQVNDNENQNKTQARDSSYKSCICALLIFLAICIIILLAGMKWSSNAPKKNTINNDGERFESLKGNSTNNSSGQIIMQTEAPKTENYTKVVHVIIQETTTKENEDTSTLDIDTQYHVESSTITLAENENSTQKFSTESTSTKDVETSTELYFIVSEKYENFTLHPDDGVTTVTESDHDKETTTKENIYASTEVIWTYNKSSSVSEEYENFTLHPDDGVTTVTENDHDKETTTEENMYASTEGTSTEDIGTYSASSSSVSEEYENFTSHPDDGVTTVTENDHDKETTTEENMYASTEGTSTEDIWIYNESSSSVSEEYENFTSHLDDGVTTVTENDHGKETTTEENMYASTDGTSTEAIETDSTEAIVTPIYGKESSENENSSLDPDNFYLETTTATSVPDIIIARVSQSIISPTNEPTTGTSTEDSTYSINEEHTTPTTDESRKFREENVSEFTLPDDSMGMGDPYELTVQTTTDSSTSDFTTLTTDESREFREENESEFTLPDDSMGMDNLYEQLTEQTTTDTSVSDSSTPTADEPQEKTTQPSGQLTENIDANRNGQQSQNQRVVYKPEICTSAECKTVASRMLALMNHSEDPCDDFYKFACGEVQVNNNDGKTWDRLSKQIFLINDTARPHFKTLKKFYTSCVEHEQIFNYTHRVSQVSELVKEVSWIMHNKEDSGSIDLTSLFAKLILRQSLPIFDVEVDIDVDTSKFVLKLVPPPMYSILAESGQWSTLSENQIRCLLAQRDAIQSPKLDLNKIYSSYLNCQKDQGILVNSIESAVESFGFYSNTTNWFDKKQRITELRTTIEWDILEILSELPAPNVIRKTLQSKNTEHYTATTVKYLNDKYPLINWIKLFEIITGKSIITDSTRINVYFPDYLDKIFEQLQNPRKCTDVQINNALISMYAYNLYQNLVMSQARHQRENYCVKLSAKLFQDLSNNLYVKSWNRTDFHTYQTLSFDIFSQLKNKLKTEVESQIGWLDKSSKKTLLQKLNSIKLVVNTLEDRYNDDNYLALQYQMDFTEDNWPSNVVKMLEKYRTMLYSIQGSKFSTDTLWSHFINAYDSTPTSFYSQTLTVAPLGTMKQYTEKVPNYITMIKIGLPLAREVGHHFDPEGIVNKMALFGNSWYYYHYMKILMNNNTLNTTSMLVENQEVSFDVDTELSSNERIADNTALRLLNLTYNDNVNMNPDLPWISTSYSKQKLFFILVAQEYCSKTSMSEFILRLFESEILPPTLRVKNIVKNSEEFSRTFQCSAKSKKIGQVSYKIQFPYLDYLDVERYISLLN